MSLNEKLEHMREASWGSWPKERRAAVERAAQDLSQSGILDRVLKTGEKAPDFTLPSADGSEVRLSKLLRTGSVVLTFYRGHW